MIKHLYLATSVFCATLAMFALRLSEQIQLLADPMNPYVVSLVIMAFALMGMYQLECAKEEYNLLWSE